MSKRPPCPVIYLIIILVLHCLRGILVFCSFIWKKCKCMEGKPFLLETQYSDVMHTELVHLNTVCQRGSKIFKDPHVKLLPLCMVLKG